MNSEAYSYSIFRESFQPDSRRSRLQKYLASLTILASLTTLSSCQRQVEEPMKNAPARTSLTYSQPTDETKPADSDSWPLNKATPPAAPSQLQSLEPDLEVYYGDECQDIKNESESNLISMDYLNVANNVYSGEENNSLKQGLVRRVSQVVSSSNKDYVVELTTQQQAVIQSSVGGLVKQTYGQDILPNDRQYFVTVASFHDDNNHSLIDTGKLEGDLPVLIKPDLNYCVFDLAEAQIQ